MKRKPHTVILKELQEWYQDEEITYATSFYERKRLSCTLCGEFCVRTPLETHYIGGSMIEAVRTYNAIVDKYIEPNIPFTL